MKNRMGVVVGGGGGEWSEGGGGELGEQNMERTNDRIKDKTRTLKYTQVP